ncbi:MAG TPA: nucleotidyltransferase family protein, partial [Burkholderiaceae bacterium]
MRIDGLPLLVRVLRGAQPLAALTLPQWELLVRQARRANLLASLHAYAMSSGQLAAVPPAPLRHLQWAGVVADKHLDAVRWEVRQIAHALAPSGVPVVLLKGAAYVMAGLPAADGRMFSDVDIMVPKARLGQIEGLLLRSGWIASHHDAYDQRYYRQWMHELPPMQHLKRQTVIDVHHAILPETARLRPEPYKLLASTVPLTEGVRVFAPADMVLHSAVHLFHEGEYHHGL